MVAKALSFAREDFAVMAANATATARFRAAMAETQWLRQFAVAGDYFPMSPIQWHSGWAAFQYHLPDNGSGFALFFRRPNCSTATFHGTLRSIGERHSHFQLQECHTFWCEARPYRVGRAQLANVSVTLRSPRSSLLLKYEPVT